MVQLEGIVPIGIVASHALMPYHRAGRHLDTSHLLVPTLFIMIEHSNPQWPVQIEIAQYLTINIKGIPVRIEAVLDVIGPVDGLPPRDTRRVVDEFLLQSKVAI